jgi:hypothetical protein
VRPAHRRRGAEQRLWFAFAEVRDHWWQRLLRRGFRHCFAALEDGRGWTVLEPLSGQLLVVRLDVPASYDLPGFYRRAGFHVLGPFAPGHPKKPWFPARVGCAALCASLLGDAVPQVWTPWQLFRALNGIADDRKKSLTRTLYVR